MEALVFANSLFVHKLALLTRSKYQCCSCFIPNFCKGAAQRFALAAGGRDEIRFESRKSPKPEKCL
jgi:hypothetical protein